MSSMVAMELRLLANLSLHALSPPRPADAALLNARADELSAAISEHLWDASIGAFANKFSANGSFYRRISPTSFYPLMARAATDAQAPPTGGDNQAAGHKPGPSRRARMPCSAAAKGERLSVWRRAGPPWHFA